MTTTDDVIRLAAEAGFQVGTKRTWTPGIDSRPFVSTIGEECQVEVARLIELAKAEEREACASIVENADTPDCGGWTAQGIADAIQARSKEQA